MVIFQISLYVLTHLQKQVHTCALMHCFSNLSTHNHPLDNLLKQIFWGSVSRESPWFSRDPLVGLRWGWAFASLTAPGMLMPWVWGPRLEEHWLMGSGWTHSSITNSPHIFAFQWMESSCTVNSWVLFTLWTSQNSFAHSPIRETRIFSLAFSFT